MYVDHDGTGPHFLDAISWYSNYLIRSARDGGLCQNSPYIWSPRARLVGFPIPKFADIPALERKVISDLGND